MANTKGLKEGDFVYITNEAASELPHLKERMWKGGMIKKIEGEVAEVHVTTVERIHVSKITTSDNAYDPIV